VADEEFRIELDAYSGPMDLLLYLIQKEEVDVHDIPVARILEKYLEALRAAPVLDLDRAGEFLVMASNLLAVKSAMLLPNEDPVLGELVDPREDLVRQIIEYRRVKESGGLLREMQEEASLRWPRGRGPTPELPADEAAGPPGVREATLYDIFATFHRLLRETASDEPRRIRYDEVPMEVHVDRILGAIGTGGGSAGLPGLLGDRRDRAFVLGTFLAILELMKEGRILAVQPEAGEEILVILQDSDAGRAALAAIAERARRHEAETPEGKPRKRPPWKKDEPGAPA
jgi:segregation and condensation protein A